MPHPIDKTRELQLFQLGTPVNLRSERVWKATEGHGSGHLWSLPRSNPVVEATLLCCIVRAAVVGVVVVVVGVVVVGGGGGGVVVVVVVVVVECVVDCVSFRAVIRSVCFHSRAQSDRCRRAQVPNMTRKSTWQRSCDWFTALYIPSCVVALHHGDADGRAVDPDGGRTHTGQRRLEDQGAVAGACLRVGRQQRRRRRCRDYITNMCPRACVCV